MAASVGWNVTPCTDVPIAGWVLGVVKTNDPGTLAAPPLSDPAANVWPIMIEVAAGGVVTTGVALATVTFTWSEARL